MNSYFFFFNDTATTEIYTLSLHDALPISVAGGPGVTSSSTPRTSSRTTTTSRRASTGITSGDLAWERSEEHTSELQSQSNLVCRLLLEKKKNRTFCSSSTMC